MHLRLILVAISAAIAGAIAIPPGALSGDAGRVLVTFIGLVAASLLPTITLIVNSMSSNGRSVAALNDLNRELASAIDNLLMLFGLSAIGVLLLVLLATPPPNFVAEWGFSTILLNRLGQGLVCSLVGLVVIKMSAIPAILRRVLEIRHAIAVDEAFQALEDKAPTAVEVKSMFPTKPGFGKTVDIEDLRRDS